jgi:molybdopterin/thiamine biosynthesis adenylyltransferase
MTALRYLRHIDLPQIGFAGQEKIAAGSVVIVGLGGLGAPAALYLAGAGVGRLGLVDDDRVEETNLQRQVLYREADAVKNKTLVAKERLEALNSTIRIETFETRLAKDNADEILAAYDVVLDCTDNFAARFLINEACVRLKKTLVSASVQGFAGQLSVFKTSEKDQPCYACVFPQTPPEGMVPTCTEAGVFGPNVGMLGVLQAGEALKALAGLGEAGILIEFDTLTLQSKKLQLAKNPHCTVCGNS